MIITDTVRADIRHCLDQGRTKTMAVKEIVKKYHVWPGYVCHDFVRDNKDIQKEVDRQIEERAKKANV